MKNPEKTELSKKESERKKEIEFWTDMQQKWVKKSDDSDEAQETEFISNVDYSF